MAYNRDSVNQIFQSSLGRAGTDAEHQFLQPYVDQGYISPYQIGQYLQGSPEATQTRMGQQQGQYADTLKQNNAQILGQAADAANGSFAQAGRQFSTGQGNSVIQAGQQLASEQSPMIANFYGNNAMGLNQQYAGQGQDALGRAYGLQDTYRQHEWDVQDYNRQQNDYNNYLNSANRRARGQALGSMGGALAGGLLGAYVPGGSALTGMLGAKVGSMAGGLF